MLTIKKQFRMRRENQEQQNNQEVNADLTPETTTAAIEQENTNDSAMGTEEAPAEVSAPAPKRASRARKPAPELTETPAENDEVTETDSKEEIIEPTIEAESSDSGSESDAMEPENNKNKKDKKSKKMKEKQKEKAKATIKKAKLKKEKAKAKEKASAKKKKEKAKKKKAQQKAKAKKTEKAKKKAKAKKKSKKK